jgi:RNA polymerase sigma-70 factor (ECF subfamily)
MVDLSACVRGEKRAWDTFAAQAAPIILAAVRRTLRRYGADPQQAEDLAQDVFVRLVRNRFRLLRSFDPTRASLSTWLSLVARSTTIDQLRRAKPHAAALEEVEDRRAAAGREPPGPALEALDVPPGLLSPRQHLVLQLLFDRDMSVHEAAQTLGVEPQTIRSTKHKAIARLREFLKGR